MHVGLSDSQRELRDSVRSVLAAECPPELVRECFDDPDRWRGLWKTVVDLGWTGLAQPDEDLGCVELVLLLEECGRAGAPIPLTSSVGLASAATVLRNELASGVVGTLAISGVASRTLAPALALHDGRVRGTAGSVTDASRAEVFAVVLADQIAVIRAGAVHTGTPLDPSRPLGDVTFDAEPESVTAFSRSELARPLTAAAAELVGTAARSLEMAVAYAKQREQFGQAIGAFQGVKHKLSDSYVALERARSLTYLAAMTVDSGVDAWRAAALAKAAASEAALTAARTCVQVHGAIAQTWEHDAHLFVRKAWQQAAVMGDARVLYREVARCS